MERDFAAEKECLLESSYMSGMAELATSVLHNVGNILTSVNVAAGVASELLRKSRISGLSRVTDMLAEHRCDLAAFLSQDPRGRQLPEYLAKLVEHLLQERTQILKELGSVVQGVEHMKTVIGMQQAYAKVGGGTEVLRAADLVDDAIQLNSMLFQRSCIQVERQYAALPAIIVEKHKLLLILMNLLSNARHALSAAPEAERQLLVKLCIGGPGRLCIAISDNGIGITEENVVRIFQYGFTTKKDGHGFGLHSSALAAREMGGTLICHSDGPGRGATFTLDLPLRPVEKAT